MHRMAKECKTFWGLGKVRGSSGFQRAEARSVASRVAGGYAFALQTISLELVTLFEHWRMGLLVATH